MKIADTVRRQGLGVCKTFCAMAIVLMFIASFGSAAPQDRQPEKTPKGDKEVDTKVEQRGTVTVEVLMIESDQDKESLPVAGASIHIKGNDLRETNETGRVRFSGVPTGELNIQIIVANVEICKVSGITVSEGEQLVVVLVDKSQKGKCTRLK